MQIAFLVALAVVGFAVWFVGLWCGISWLASRGGWQRLAATYRSDAPAPPGRAFPQTTGYVGRSRYRHALTVTVGTEGLHLAVSPLFTLGHPPLLIPWGDLAEAPLDDRHASVGVAFRADGAADVRLLFERAGAGEAITAVQAYVQSAR